MMPNKKPANENNGSRNKSSDDTARQQAIKLKRKMDKLDEEMLMLEIEYDKKKTDILIRQLELR